MSTELVKVESGELQARPSIDAVDILRAAVAGGITESNVAVVERMAALVERQQDRQAERSYIAALAELQSACENVVATKDVDGKFRYAPFLDLWNAVRPEVQRNRFTIQWSQEHLGDRIKITLWLQHESGHKKDFSLSLMRGSDAPGNPNAIKATVIDEITESRAKRRCLMNALNIVVDATAPAEDVGDGSLASQEETDELFKRLLALEPDDAKRASSERRFLAIAGVASWNQIPKNALPILSRLMSEKERARKAT